MSQPTAVDSIIVENVSLDSGPYRLQAELAYPEQDEPEAIAVVAGPHPLLGGHMHNNVVRRLGDGLAERGLLTVRFNYRGVAGSDGPTVSVREHVAQFFATSHVPGELDLWQDVKAAVVFARQVGGSSLPLVLIGYSFGCALLSHVRCADADTALVLVAPTIAKHDYGAFLDDERPKLVIASEDDFATDAGDLRRWFALLCEPKRLILERFDNHFFRGHEEWLIELINAFLQGLWRSKSCS